jgi:large subunit ribosomal protein L4
MYDLAWRTALSYRYRKGELVICEDGMEIESARGDYLRQVFAHNHWGNEDGRSLVITTNPRERLFMAMRNAGEDGRAQAEPTVDVKDLLELGRIIIEKSALDKMLQEHQSDLVKRVASAAGA